ncbi:MAG: nucleotidyltransferase family protein [Lacrimispora saccharolytica]
MSIRIESRHKQALRYAMEKISCSPLAPYVNELYLYGSYARGTQTWESDVDLLLTLDANAPNLKKEIIKLKAEVSQDGIDDVQVDLKVLYGDDWKTSQMLYYQNIRREGKKLW